MKHHETEALREMVKLLERMTDGITKNSRMLVAQELKILNEMKSKNKNVIITIEGRKERRSDGQTQKQRRADRREKEEVAGRSCGQAGGQAGRWAGR